MTEKQSFLHGWVPSLYHRKAELFAWLGSIPLPQKSRAFCMVGFHPFTTEKQSFLHGWNV
jgi:hypothetical protein